MSHLPIVFVVDDDPSVLKAVSRLLRAASLNVVTFGSAQEFLDHHDPAAHGCVVLDLAMPGINGLELQQALAARDAPLPIIFLTGRADVPMSVRAMKQGAADFLTKPADEGKLVSAIHAALAKDRVVREARNEVAEIRRRLATLTPREYEVFEHVVSGKLNKVTASELGTVEKTIKVHRSRVMDKMQAQSLAELVRIAERAGIAATI
jgi:FixJ family two-component response regulator